MGTPAANFVLGSEIARYACCGLVEDRFRLEENRCCGIRSCNLQRWTQTLYSSGTIGRMRCFSKHVYFGASSQITSFKILDLVLAACVCSSSVINPHIRRVARLYSCVLPFSFFALHLLG